MAAKKTEGFQKVPNTLNLWKPKKKNDALVGLVNYVNPNGKFGLTVKVMEPDGAILTLPSHKVLQDRLANVPGGLKSGVTILRITYTGDQKGANWPTPMEMYEVEYRDKTENDIF